MDAKPAKKDWQKTSSKIGEIFFFLFFIEAILGSNGHWFQISILGHSITPKMVLFALLLIGFLVYLIVSKSWVEN